MKRAGPKAISAWHIVRVGLVVLGIGAFSAVPSAQVARYEPVTFTKDIAPILQRSCQNCHRPQAMAPMPLITFEDVRPWARAIKQKTGRREMPPWFIEKNVGIQRFKDDPSLTDEEIATIEKWVDSGAPRGNPAEMPPLRTFGDGAAWSVGGPDLVVSSPVVTVKAVAPDFFGPIGQTPIGLTEDRYIQAVEVREVRLDEDKVEKVSGRADLTLFAVHHATIQATEGSQDPEAPSSGRRPADGGFSHTHEVGQNALFIPDDVGVLLKAGSVLDFPNVHLHSAGKDVRVRLDVGLKLYPKGYQPKYLMSSIGDMGTELLDIPAGQDDVRVDAFYTLQRPAKLLTFEPHMHARGKRMCVEAIYPTAQRETLNCAGYNHNWVKVYTYEDAAAPLLPAGTIIRLTGWYDNTPNNPRNPEPRNWAGFGSRSIDDMFYNLAKVIFLTEDQFKSEIAARQRSRLAQAERTQR
jgi:hypothetical protein